MPATKDAVHECDVRYSPHCAGNVTGGVNMVYLSHHCHAPSCLKAELWNADTGELICRQVFLVFVFVCFFILVAHL